MRGQNVSLCVVRPGCKGCGITGHRLWRRAHCYDPAQFTMEGLFQQQLFFVRQGAIICGAVMPKMYTTVQPSLDLGKISSYSRDCLAITQARLQNVFNIVLHDKFSWEKVAWHIWHMEDDTLMIISYHNNHNFKPVSEEIHLLATKRKNQGVFFILINYAWAIAVKSLSYMTTSLLRWQQTL